MREIKEELERRYHGLDAEDIVDAFYNFIDEYNEDDSCTDEMSVQIESYIASDHYGFLNNDQLALQVALTLQFEVEAMNSKTIQVKTVLYFYANDTLRAEFPVITDNMQESISERLASGELNTKEMWKVLKEARKQQSKAKKTSMWLFTTKDFKKANKLFDKIFNLTNGEGYIGHAVYVFDLG